MCPPLPSVLAIFRLLLVCTAAVCLTGAVLVADDKGKTDAEPKEKKGPSIAEMKQAILKHITQKT
ncbi:MAG: hypothetical protein K2R98_22640, partial [Gemmataceae bacterium]|nr:hypothetical protein [Gemmataceae bacterium]